MMHKSKNTLYTILTIIMLLGVLPHSVNASDTDIVVDNEKPLLEYAYVEGGMLRLTISDNIELDSRPIYFKADRELRYYYLDIDDYYYEYEGRFRRDRYYEIEVEVPSKVSVTLRDKAGNESTYSLNIKEDNAPVTKQIPIFIIERLSKLKQSVVDTFEGFDNIFEVEYGKLIHAISIYDEIISDNYRHYNKNEIKFKVSGLSMDREGNIKLDKYGIFKVTMTHSKDKTFEEIAYLLIKPDWRNPDDRRLPVNISPYIVYSDKIKVADYFRYDDEIVTGKKSKSKVDTSYMLVYNEDIESLVTMSDAITLELNKPYNLSVLNFEDNSMQEFYIMRQEKSKTKSKSFSDVDKNHWASKDINSLVSKGLLSGYSNGTFEPSGNITVKEFMTILSRYIATSPNIAKPVIGDVTTPVSYGTWGYIETKSILDRLTDTNLYRFGYRDLDRLITREEVAFLIDSTLELGIPYNPNINNRPRDIALSIYKSEVEKLVDLGFISGYPDGNFKPYNNITRAEVAALFAKMK
ncbi:MAG: S-layer homology domain-containing protein [Tissierella sp.]|nr:S-layer homology domain-containing protein [Tissierella sp.]